MHRNMARHLQVKNLMQTDSVREWCKQEERLNNALESELELQDKHSAFPQMKTNPMLMSWT
jgi:hypothetical protein